MPGEITKGNGHTGHKAKHPCRGLLFPLLALLLAVLSVLALAFPVRYSILRTQYPICYASAVEQYGTQYDIPPSLLYAVIRTESRFQPDVRSAAGAVGLVQMLPSTFRWLSDEMLGEHLADGMLFDPDTNIRYGACYLRLLYNRYRDWATSLAAYNAGSGKVDTWLSNPELCLSESTLNPDTIPFKETRAYVKAVLRAQSYYCQLYPEIEKLESTQNRYPDNPDN